MNWLASLFIALLTAVAGCFGTFGLAALCIRWYRISSFEGGAGYFAVFLALVGTIVSFFVGLIATRIAAAQPDPGFFKGLGYAFGSIAGLLLVATGICRLCADLPPTKNGADLQLAVEIRCPKNFKLPADVNDHGASASIKVLSGYRSRANDYMQQGKLRFDEATQVDGHWLVKATVPIGTRRSDKMLLVWIDDQTSSYFPLYREGTPAAKNFVWTAWLEGSWKSGETRPAAEDAFFARYRVEQVPTK